MIYCQTRYTRYNELYYIHGIYHVYTMHMPWDGHLLARLVAHPRLEASNRDFRGAFQFWPQRGRPHEAGAVQSSTTSVDLVNMAAPPWGRASTGTISGCTAAPKSVLLPASVLMWNSWGCISVQKAWNEWNSAEEVLSPPDVESGNRQICPVHHGSKRGINLTMAGMMCSSYSPKNHWCSSSFGQDVRTLKSVDFIQALGGNSLWSKRSSSSLICQQYYSVSCVYITSILTI